MPLRLAPLQEWMLGPLVHPTSNPLPLGLSSPVRAGLESARV